jgi:hypothetical protein
MQLSVASSGAFRLDAEWCALARTPISEVRSGVPRVVGTSMDLGKLCESLERVYFFSLELFA